MTRLWTYLWIILILAQIVTVWISRKALDGIGRDTMPADQSLVPLALATNKLWPAVPEGDSPGAIADSPADLLLLRESLILRLRDVETNLTRKGVEMEIVDDLQGFLASLQGAEQAAVINNYLSGLLEWLGQFAKENMGCRIDRLAMHPGIAADLPSIAFELSGDPLAMGRRLSESNTSGSLWSLDEMDIFLPRGEQGGWMRGSCGFMGPSVR